jgi:uncharacterized protein (TIGR03435 family)
MCGVLLVGLASAQLQPETPKDSFEVASVKLDAPGASRRASLSGGPGTGSPTRINYSFVTLEELIGKAFGLGADQISGPKWLATERYSVDANVPLSTTDEGFKKMLQNLLFDRLGLRTHLEKKDFTVYEMVPAGSGFKLDSAAEGEAPEPKDEAPAAGKMLLDREGCPILRKNGRGQIAGNYGPTASCSSFVSTTMVELAKILENIVAAEEGAAFGSRVHVVDSTGINGKFDFTLTFVYYPRFPGFVQAPPPNGIAGPNIFAALAKIGLRLEKKKTPLDMLVIDQAEKYPSPN